MVALLEILLGISLALLIPLAAGKVWKCNEDERIMKRADRGSKLVYPRIYQRQLGVLPDT